ncbi:GmrSD restriction endonuclease domain-containing protein [Microbispora bryophytorum]|uniref:GmrSD restriction endonuclease domain-containing protein n=1 Tax=Microbispora bryophytorum TaxID=1460882 RepID=UPI0033D41693
MATLSVLLNQIDDGTVLLPEFQRGYVWNRDQVRGLMRSLYRGYPVGGLLLWATEPEMASVRGAATAGGVRLLLLDGQQRITSLYGIMRGKPPAFFDGDPSAFTGLRFNVEDETFEFYGPAKMRDDPRWVDVTRLFVEGLEPFIGAFTQHSDKFATYIARLNKLKNLENREFHEEKITGPDKNVDVVVDIFNRVNSGGTALSKGDLALAKICAQWAPARQVMRDHLNEWQAKGFDFSLDWLLRNITAVATGRAVFTALDTVKDTEFETALTKSVEYVDTLLGAASGRLGLDHDQVLMGRYAIPVVSRLLHLTPGGDFLDSAHRDRVLFWYVHAALWGRFAGSTETILAQDYDTVERSGIDGLIASLERWRGGNLEVRPHDFDGSTRGSRFYPLLYMLTRAHGARDFGSGLELHAEMLGKLTSLQVHHIFPKALLYKAGYDRIHVNAVANFCFLTQNANLAIGKRSPEDYFAEAEDKHPGVLASQWIPMDRDLWRVDRYRDFLQARRELLAQAAQSFLTQLRDGAAPVKAAGELRPVAVIADEQDDVRAAQIKAMVEELARLGYAEPALDSEIADPASGRALAMAEAFWPDGLQPGQGKPVVLELDPEVADLPRLEELGYEVFTSVDALLGYATRRNETAAGDEQEPVAPPPSASSGVHAEFDAAMRSVYDRARSEANYHASYFLSMLAEHGSLATARRLLRSPAVSDGFAALWERGRLDLTVEALVVQPRFGELFTPAETEVARHRLEQFGWSAAVA